MQQTPEALLEFAPVMKWIKPKDNLIVAQIQVYDQYSDEFEDLIEKFVTSNSICGYCVLGSACIIAKHGFKEGLKRIRQNPQERKAGLRETMDFILNSRLMYATSNQQLLMNPIEFQNYLRDWIANYEISDYLKSQNLKEVYFIRNVAYEYPEEIPKVKFEEKQRILEEKPFTGDNYFIDQGGKFTRKAEFKRHPDHIYIIDCLGHYIVAKELLKDGITIILLLDTMTIDRLDNISVRRFFDY